MPELSKLPSNTTATQQMQSSPGRALGLACAATVLLGIGVWLLVRSVDHHRFAWEALVMPIMMFGVAAISWPRFYLLRRASRR